MRSGLKDDSQKRRCSPQPDVELADVSLERDLAAPRKERHAPVAERRVQIAKHNVNTARGQGRKDCLHMLVLSL